MREFIAGRILAYAEDNQVSLRTALKQAKRNIHPAVEQPKIRATVHALVFETYRRKGFIDRLLYQADTHLQRDRKKNPLLRNLLRIGVYRFFFEHHPIALVANSIIEASKAANLTHFQPAINALFYQLQNVTIEGFLQTIEDPEERIAVQFFHPTWLVRDWAKQMPEHELKALLMANNKPLPVYLRLSRKKDIEETLKLLSDEKVQVIPDSDLSDVLKVVKTEFPIPRLPSFKKGYYYLQDKGSALVSHVLDPRPEERIFDACAAPGGKTTHIASLMNNQGEILAIDNSMNRLTELRAKVLEYQCKKVHIIAMSLRYSIGLSSRVLFDKILIDAPCSGTGTFSSRPEAKWRHSRRDVKWYARIQGDILETCANYLKPQGFLVYSTCSLHHLENEKIVQQFIAKNSEFAAVKPNPIIGDLLKEPVGQRLYPHKHKTEGFSIFKLQRGG
ncbi:MAG: RsmB/NOP family class I SAM-dependent RNA methyltransferase [Candidatus Hodarchaeales archaeon]|jgi:16S rRNA (cytosine967-C5)-methyltransferase